ncbi:MAG: GspH/FimT family protein [Thermodesulfobacteriota bacterium]|nr:GspH/FimT family protein [Thermodesulfobacteriota bacterium]
MEKKTDHGTKEKKAGFFQPGSGSHGFSLIELVVVIAIIGIITALGTPPLLSMKAKSSVRSDARDVYSAFKHAQSEAVKRSENVTILFNYPAPGKYTVFLDNGAGGDTSGDNVQNGNELILLSKQLRPGNSFTDNFTDGISGFNSRGLPLTGQGTVTVRSATTSLVLGLSLSNAGHVRSTVL